MRDVAELFSSLHIPRVLPGCLKTCFLPELTNSLVSNIIHHVYECVSLFVGMSSGESYFWQQNGNICLSELFGWALTCSTKTGCMNPVSIT